MSITEILRLFAEGALLFWGIYERMSAEKDKSYIKSSVRIWQHQANGISSALSKLSWSCRDDSWAKLSQSQTFTKTKDVGIALDSLHEVANSMTQSLYESRFFTDEELKANIKKDKEDKEKKEQLLEQPNVLVSAKNNK